MLRILIAAGIAMLPVQAISEEHSDLQTVPQVEVDRYLGTWYEIARFPNWFQKDCEQATAEYSLRDDQRIKVINTCRKTADGKVKQAEGVAEVVDPATHAKLKVSFVPGWLRWTGIGKGDYWIIDLASDYSFAVVSEPKRRYLWILSRKPVLSRTTYEGILARLRDRKFDLSPLMLSREGAVQ